MGMANFVRGVPKSNQLLTMMPGTFSPNGNWVVAPSDIRKMVAKLNGANFVESSKDDIRISVENSSSTEGMGRKVAKLLGVHGYRNVSVQQANLDCPEGIKRTRIIAQKANPEDASLVRTDLGSIGDIVNASVGNIESSVTVVVGNDLAAKIIEQENALTIPETAPQANSHSGITRR